MSKVSPLSHFELPASRDGNFKATCKHCSASISGSGKTSSNFTTHLKRKHPDIYSSLSKPSQVLQPTNRSDQASLFSFVPQKKYGQNDSRQKLITDSLVMFVADDLMPLSVVESVNFRTLMHNMDSRYTVPSRKHLSTVLLKQKMEDSYSVLKDILHQAQSICLTIDLWSSRQMRGFIGIIGHFILDWTLQSVVLACSRFRGSHTAENIAQRYEETVACFDIAEKISNIVTENAANMIKAFSLPGFDTENYSQEKDLDSDDEDDDDHSLDSVDMTDVLTFVPQHDPCFAHTLQLVVKDGMKQAGPINTVLGKAARIASHISRSNKASELLEDEPKVQAAVATRWNSEVKSIRSLLAIPEEKLARLDCQQLSKYDRNILQDLLDILSPFEEATDLVQGQNIVSASFVIPCVRGLRSQLDVMSSKYNCKLVIALKDSLNKRMTAYEAKETFNLATVLDPRFKVRWCKGEEATNLRCKLLHKTSSVQPESPKRCVEEAAPPPKKRSKLLSFMDKVSSAVPSKSLETEVDSYLAQTCMEDVDPLTFWRVQETTYPLLSALANKYLAVPASSGPVERLFSIAGKVFRPERCSLKDTTFETLMFVKCNGHLKK